MRFDVKKVDSLIKAQGMNRKMFAEKCGWFDPQLSYLMRAGKCRPATLQIIGQALGVPYTELLLEEKTTMKVKFDPGAKATRAHDTDAGLDLYSMEAATIPPRGIVSVNTGVHVAIPEGYCGLLTSKSGLMSMGVTSRGTIDCGFTGAIQAVLFNHRKTEVKIQKGQKITQMVIVPILTPELEVVDSLEETERGSGGFGSTGAF
jgi:dUTP pyrophosphatase